MAGEWVVMLILKRPVVAPVLIVLVLIGDFTATDRDPQEFDLFCRLTVCKRLKDVVRGPESLPRIHIGQ